MIDKKLFYEQWKPKPVYSEAKRKYVIPKVMHTDFWLRVQEQIDLHITWDADYARNIFGLFSAQLLDMSKSGSKRQICKDLIIENLWDKGLSSDYKLYRFIDKWCETEIRDYKIRGCKGVFEL